MTERCPLQPLPGCHQLVLRKVAHQGSSSPVQGLAAEPVLCMHGAALPCSCYSSSCNNVYLYTGSLFFLEVFTFLIIFFNNCSSS